MNVRETYLKASDVETAKAKKVLAFLNAARTAEEIAAAIEAPGERDVGVKVAGNIIARRDSLGGFKDLRQVASVPGMGPKRFTDTINALGTIADKEMEPSYVIEGQLKAADKVDFAENKLAVHAFVNGVELAGAEVDARGKYRLTFQYREEPPAVELRVLPAVLSRRAAKTASLSQTISPGSYVRKKSGPTIYQAVHDFLIPIEFIKLWGTVTKTYHMHGVVYATTFVGSIPVSVDPLAAARIEFYEVDVPVIWLSGTTPAMTEGYLGYAYTAPDGSYDFHFDFSYKTSPWLWAWLFSDKVPDIRARISQFDDGVWKQIYEGPVDWNIVEDFHRDYFIPKEDIIPVPDEGIKPAEGFRFVSIGLLPIDITRIQLGYATSLAGDPVSGISHQPFCGTLRIFGLFAEAPPVASYKVQFAVADEDGPIGSWTDAADPLHNSRWNDSLHYWEPMVLGPDPVTGRYQNIDIEPEANWHEHALKVTWNSANHPNGYYALRVIGYDAGGTELGAYEMPVVRTDNSVPETSLEVIGTSVGAVTKCGALKLGLDRKIQFKVTGYDAEGHVKRYWLSGTRGKAAVSAGPTFQEVRPDPAAGWVGVNDKLVEFTVSPLPIDLMGCPAVAYNFELHVRGLATNGYSAEPIAQWAEKENNLVVSEP